MYPLTVILGIAVFNNDIKSKKYVLPLSITGGLVSLLHYLEQKLPEFGGVKPCINRVPCNTEYINIFGLITIILIFGLTEKVRENQ